MNFRFGYILHRQVVSRFRRDAVRSAAESLVSPATVAAANQERF